MGWNFVAIEPVSRGISRRRKRADLPIPPNNTSIEELLGSVLTEHQNPRKRRGRPTLTPPVLRGQRDALVDLVETSWGEIGWQLDCARTPEDIRKAFQPLKGKSREHLVGFFLRQGSEAATAAEVRRTRRARGDAVKRCRNTQQVYDSQNELCQSAAGAFFELSPEYLKGLNAEFVRRRKGSKEIKAQYDRLTEKYRKAERAIRQPSPKHLETAKAKAAAYQLELQRIKTEYDTEVQVCQELKRRLQLPNPKLLKIAKDELNKRQEKFRLVKATLDKAVSEREALEKKLADQEAYYARAQLLEFIRSGRYAHTPRNLANAIAGLPYMGSRQSYERCSRLECRLTPDLNYRVFEVFTRIWHRRDSRDSKAVLELFRRGIASLPNREGNVRDHLKVHWRYLKQAVEEFLKTKAKPHPRAVPYVITANFVRNLSKPRSALDHLLAEKERTEFAKSEAF